MQAAVIFGLLALLSSSLAVPVIDQISNEVLSEDSIGEINRSPRWRSLGKGKGWWKGRLNELWCNNKSVFTRIWVRIVNQMINVTLTDPFHISILCVRISYRHIYSIQTLMPFLCYPWLVISRFLSDFSRLIVHIYKIIHVEELQ